MGEQKIVLQQAQLIIAPSKTMEFTSLCNWGPTIKLKWYNYENISSSIISLMDYIRVILLTTLPNRLIWLRSA